MIPKQKTLQLLPMYPPQNTTSLTSNLPQKQYSPLEIAVAKTLAALKKEKLLRQQKMMTAKDTSMQSTALTKAQELAKAQELCLKQFRTYHQQWEKQKLPDLAVAKYYRMHGAGMALYLFIIHPTLYKQATLELCMSGKQYPNPLTSVHTYTATDPKFILRLHKAL
jgi:hypothetical protein